MLFKGQTETESYRNFFAYAGQMVKKNIDPPQQKERKGDANSEKN